MNFLDQLNVLYINSLEFLVKWGLRIIVVMIIFAALTLSFYSSFRFNKYILKLAQSPRFVCLDVEWESGEPSYEQIRYSYLVREAKEYVEDGICHAPFADWQYMLLTSCEILFITIVFLMWKTYPRLKRRRGMLLKRKVKV